MHAGKTLLARAIASNIDANFLKVVSSAIVDKYIGESARLIREMFGYAREHQPCIIFMDEIDAIGGRRFSEGTSADREIQRTLMELLSQLDGFDPIGKVRTYTSAVHQTAPCLSQSTHVQSQQTSTQLSWEDGHGHCSASRWVKHEDSSVGRAAMLMPP